MERLNRLRTNMEQRILRPKREAITHVLVGLIVREGMYSSKMYRAWVKPCSPVRLPSLVNCERFNRIQLTPDMLPSDILGVSVYNQESKSFEFKPGPIFAHVVLADEINRTTPAHAIVTAGKR